LFQKAADDGNAVRIISTEWPSEGKPNKIVGEPESESPLKKFSIFFVCVEWVLKNTKLGGTAEVMI
jgi:hypothetical protein